jgi:hypothetical protein
MNWNHDWRSIQTGPDDFDVFCRWCDCTPGSPAAKLKCDPDTTVTPDPYRVTDHHDRSTTQ